MITKGILLLGLGVLVAAAATAAPVVTAEPVIVARSGQQIPGDTTEFSDVLAPGQKVFSVPAIDPTGRVGFSADLQGAEITTDVNDVGAFTFRVMDGVPTGQEIVRRGDPAPPSGGTSFDLGLAPSLGLGDDVMLYPTLSNGNPAIYLWQPAAGLFPVAVRGEPVASFPDDTEWRVILKPEYDGNATLFNSTISGPGGFGTGGPDLFIQSGFGQDAFRLVERGEETSPDSGVIVKNIVQGKYVTGGGSYAFVAELSPSSGSDFDALFIDGVQAQNVGDPAPDDGRTWVGWQRPTMNASGDLAITGRVADNIRGIWVKSAGGAFDKILAEGETLPFDPSLSLGTHLPINPVTGNGGAVVFSGPLTGADVTTANDGAMFWYGDDGSGLALKMPVREGDQAPFFDPGVVFSDLFATATTVNAVVDGFGNFAFRARLSGPGINSGNDLTAWVWLAERQALVPILQEGDPIEIAPGDVRNFSETDFAIGGIDDDQQVAMRVAWAFSSQGGQGRMVLLAPTAPPLVVNSTGDAPDEVPGDKFCDTGNTMPDGSAECTLRAAIQEANARLGADTIRFAIPGGVIPTIAVASPLPAATEALTIDGTTQPEGQVELNGAGASATGLTIAADNSLMRGMVVNRFPFGGITVVDASGVTLENNRIGTDPNGLSSLPNGLQGVLLNDASGALLSGNLIAANDGPGVLVDSSGVPATGITLTSNQIGGAQAGDGLGNAGAGVHIKNARLLTIGGTIPGDGNLISGNDAEGIVVEGVPDMDDLNQFLGNRIGTDSSGFFAHPNQGDGLRLGPDTTANVIGGLTSGEPNVIANNLGNGVRAEGNVTVIQGNWIRANQVAPDAPINSSGHGVLIAGSGNSIGDTADGGGNFIADNGGDGILVLSGNTVITRNSIVGNAGLGINLDEDGLLETRDGITANDNGDADSGANGLQNKPVILRTTDGTEVEGLLSSAPNTTYNLEFFSNSQATSPLQAETFLTAVDVITDASGVAGFTLTLPMTGERVTATATDPNGNTSELSVPPLIVNSAGDKPDANPGDEVCDTGDTVGSDPECTLRAAIQEANALEGPDEVFFDIPGTPPHYIAPSSALPNILDRIIINATSQPGFADRQPVVEVVGDFAGESNGFNIDSFGASELRGLIIKRFTINGVSFINGDLTLHDVILFGNGNNGISGTGMLKSTGLLRVEDSNRDSTNPLNECDQTAGINIQGSVLAEDLELVNNCGDGLSVTGDLTVQGGLTARDNSHIGIRAKNVSITGSTHSITGNGLAGIFSQVLGSGMVDIAGSAVISNNGHQLEFPENLRDPCNADFGPGGVLAETFAADDLVASENCGNGIKALAEGLATDFHVRIRGNATVQENLGDGIKLVGKGSITLEGTSHDISGNDSYGLFALNGSVWLAGNAHLANNFAALRTSNPAACLGDTPSAIFARGRVGPFVGVHRGDVVATNLTVVDNCGTGVKALALLDIAGSADISRNLGDGVLAGAVRILGGGRVARNENFGLVLAGGFVDVDGVCICFNGRGGISGNVQPPPSPMARADTPTISASHIVGNGGDGVRLLGGSGLTIIGSNLYGNAGLAIRNFSGNEVVAQGNWWGDATGPGGEAAGSGDQVAGAVDATVPLTAPVAAIDSDGDGVPDFIEDGAPNDGDGNGDLIADALQPEVVSLLSVSTGRYLTLAAPVSASWQSAMTIGNPSPEDAPAGSFADGFVNGELSMSSSPIVVDVHQSSADGFMEWHGHGPTPDEGSDHWYGFALDGDTGFDATTNPPTLTFSDGDRGDHDLVVDGQVVHRGGAILAGPAADLAVEHASVEPMQAIEGQTVTYTLTVSNAGPDEATDLILINRLPDGFVFLDVSGAGWTCRELDGTITCTMSSLSSSQSSILTIQAQAGGVGEQGNTVEVYAIPFDPEPFNDVSYSLVDVKSDAIFATRFEAEE